MALQDRLLGGLGLSSTLRVPSGETVDELPAAGSRANKYLGFDSAGLPALLTGGGGGGGGGGGSLPWIDVTASPYNAVGDGVQRRGGHQCGHCRRHRWPAAPSSISRRATT